jgi:hypothetical protein
MKVQQMNSFSPPPKPIVANEQAQKPLPISFTPTSVKEKEQQEQRNHIDISAVKKILNQSDRERSPFE